MSKYITAYYSDEEDLLKGIGQIKADGLKIMDEFLLGDHLQVCRGMHSDRY